MRDHPLYYTPILAELFGVRPSAMPTGRLIPNHFDECRRYGDDQIFLAATIYEIFRRSRVVHDTFFIPTTTAPLSGRLPRREARHAANHAGQQRPESPAAEFNHCQHLRRQPPGWSQVRGRVSVIHWGRSLNTRRTPSTARHREHDVTNIFDEVGQATCRMRHSSRSGHSDDRRRREERVPIHSRFLDRCEELMLQILIAVFVYLKVAATQV